MTQIPSLYPNEPYRPRQRGAALVVSLIILLIMTLIGISSMQGTNMDEKMVGNMRDREIALQAAEAALREGEETDTAISTFTNATGAGGYYAMEASIDPFASATWSSANSKAYAGTLHAAPSIQVAAAPRYILQYRGELPFDAGVLRGTRYGSGARRHVIRTIGRGTGLTNNSQVYLESDAVVLR